MAEQVTKMLLKVHDLECSKCYKKVKKILCKFPQIQDQVYDEKNNTVIIKVVCCSPEKIRDKICCKGRGIIISIEILKPTKTTDQADSKPTAPAPAPVVAAGAGAGATAIATATATAPEVKIEDKTSIVVNFFDVPKPPEKPKPPEEPKKPEEPKTHEVKIKDKNTIEVNFFDVPKPWYVNPPVCSCGCGGNRDYCRWPVCSCGCGGRDYCRRLVCSCGCGGNRGHCGRPVCSCGCGGNTGHCGRPVCSCGCGGYRGNCVYYLCEDNSQGCTIM